MIKPTNSMKTWRSNQERLVRMIRRTTKAIDESRELLNQTNELLQRSQALCRSRIKLVAGLNITSDAPRSKKGQ